MRNKLLPLIFILLLGFIFVDTTNVLAFSDTDKHWSSSYVDSLSSKNIIEGYEDGTFKPDNSISKVEFYKMINSMAGYSRVYTVSFADVKKTDWFYDDVAKAIKAGYITPTTGNLNPNNPISREEVMRIVGVAYKLDKKPIGVESFKDKDSISDEAIGYVGTLVGMGVVEGFPGGTINPKQDITRGEISKILTTIMDQLGNPKDSFLVDSEIKFGPKGLHE